MPEPTADEAQIWSSQLRIAAGRAVEDAPQVGFAEKVDRLGRLVRLSILAESASAGADAFVDQFVRRIGELFDPSARSLTGALKVAVEAAHEELRGWNRQHLPPEQAMYGLSCLMQRGDQPALLAQAGPSAALLAGDSGLADLRRLSFHRHPTAAGAREDDPVAAPIGGSAPIAVEFAEAPAATGWALLFTANAAPLLDAERRVTLSRLAVDDALRHLYPILLPLRDTAVLAVGVLSAGLPELPEAGADDDDSDGPDGADEGDVGAEREGDEEEEREPEPPPEAPAPPSGISEVRFEPVAVAGLETLRWPINPFALAGVQQLDSALPRVSLPGPRLSGPIMQLDRALPSLLERSAERAAERPKLRPGDERARSAAARRVGMVLAGMAVVLLIVAAALLGPSLLRSDADQFRASIERARNGLAASELAVTTEGARLALQDALGDVEAALELNPLAAEGLQLREDIEAVLSELNLVQLPGELSELADLSGFGPSIALGAVRFGGGRTFVLDDAGGRVFTVSAEGAVQVLFLEGELLGLGSQLRAGRPISIAWQPRQANATDGLPAADGLWILDSNARLFRWTASGVLLVPIPELVRLGSVDAVAATAGSIYLLDRSGGAVWRFAVERTELSAPSRAVGRTDLQEATELTAAVNADGLVEFLVASGDGRLRRFSGEEELPLAIDLERELLAPASISIGAQSGLIYVVDRGRGRIVAVSAEGGVVSQIQSPELSDLRGAWINEESGQIVYALPDSLVVGRLPSSQE